MASEHLILLVAAVIILNRGFDSTGLKLNRAAYVVTQLFDLAMVVVLFLGRLSELPIKADYTIRLFLMAFVVWHMVRNSQSRTKALRLREIMLAQREIVARKNRAMRGKVVEVVVDGKAPGRRDMWIARSRVQAPDVDSITWVKGRNLRPGQFLKILVTGSRGYDLWARPAMRIR